MKTKIVKLEYDFQDVFAFFLSFKNNKKCIKIELSSNLILILKMKLITNNTHFKNVGLKTKLVTKHALSS